MSEESAVKVCVRIRPLIEREESETAESGEPVQLFWEADQKSIHQIDDGNSTKNFNFDRVFTAEESTDQLYQDIAKPLVVSSVEGYNGTIFAYGQTSSGKTFTMMGSKRSPGVLPLAVEDVFQTIKNCPKKEFLLRVSYMEIYNETVTDLLVDNWKRKPLEVRETINKTIFVSDLTEEMVTSPAQALAWIRKGEKNRHYGKTKMNQRSSRSHTIFRMILESRERSEPASGENADGAIIVSHLNLVDLAGSERASQTGAEGTRFKEGCNINRSLFTLGQVIKKLTDESQKGFTNYRDSKLTRILQNSLGGNAKTVIICTITPVALDETLSTLQFASTAKKMKNDPHVTECSDDGALLKRYRNEIVDLKRRLQEVSSATQTTDTEKQFLSQMLQEKDQLQREQQDRIRNLTKLMVTSSNVIMAPKIPKRRVTWGGKMLRLEAPSADGSSDLSYAESVTRKRKAERSYLSELGEEDEDFDSSWGIPDGPLDEMGRVSELSGKVSNLEHQLEVESQQKEDALTKVERLEERLTELEEQLTQRHQAVEEMESTQQRATQLQTEEQHKQEAQDKTHVLELRVADLERQLEEQSHNTQGGADKQMSRAFAETLQLCESLASEKELVSAERDYLKKELGMWMEQTSSLQKENSALSLELEEKRDTEEFEALEESCRKEQENKNEFKIEISSLKKAVESSELQCLEFQNKLKTLSEELEKKSDFAEKLQSMIGKDLVQEVAMLQRSLDDAEALSRDTKKEWALLRSAKISLEETNSTLSANHEKMDAEVNSLRLQLETEKTRFRKMQSDLQKELNVAFEENTKLTTLLDGKVPKNLIDSMELGRTVATLNKELSACHGEEELRRPQLEELALLQTLPDKVDSLLKQECELKEQLCAVEAHRDGLLLTQAQCSEESGQLRDALHLAQEQILTSQSELSAAEQRETELREQCAFLRQQQDSLSSAVELSDAEKSQLMANIEETALKECELKEQLCAVEAHRDGLLLTQAQCSEESGQLKDALHLAQEQILTSQSELSAAEQRETELREQCAFLRQQQDSLSSAVELSDAEKSQLMANMEETALKLEESERHRASLSQKLDELQQLQMDSEVSRATEGISKELQEQLTKLTEELECVRAERDSVVCEQRASSELLATERDQPRRDLQENVDIAAETQVPLLALQDQLQGQRCEGSDLLTHHEQKPSDSGQHSQSLPQECVGDDRETMAHVQTAAEESEKLLSTLASLTEERDQLKMDLHENVEMMIEIQGELRTALEKNCKNKKRIKELETSQTPAAHPSAQVEELQTAMQCEFQQQLGSAPQTLREEQDTQQLEQIQQLEKTKEEVNQLKSDLQEHVELIERLSGELQSVRAERDSLCERSSNTHSDMELLLRVKSLSEDRDQLMETLEGLREDKKQLRDQLDHHMETTSAIQEKLSRQEQQQAERQQQESELQQQVRSLTEKLESIEAEREALLSEKNISIHQSSQELDELLLRVKSLSEDRDQLMETLEGLREDKKQLRDQLDHHMETTSAIQEKLSRQEQQQAKRQQQESELQQQVRSLTEKLESIEAEREALLSEKNISIHQSSQELDELLLRVKSLSEDRDQLMETLEGLREDKKQLTDQLDHHMETTSAIQEKLSRQEQQQAKRQQQESELQQQVRSLTEKLESIEAEREALLSEKNISIHQSSQELDELLLRVKSLSEDRDQLMETLEGLREDKKQLRDQLDHHMETTSAIQEKLSRQEQQQAKRQQQESELQQQVRSLTEKLESIEAEREALLSEKNISIHQSSQELDELLLRVKSLSEDRDQLMETLEGLREDKKQLRDQLDHHMETTSAIQEKLSRQEQQQAKRQQQESELQQQVQQLEEQLHQCRGRLAHAEAEAYTKQQLLSEATVREQRSTLDQSSSAVKETLSSRLQESAEQLQGSFGKFLQVIDFCSKYDKELEKSLPDQPDQPSFPKRSAVNQLKYQNLQSLGNILKQLVQWAQSYRTVFEELLEKDLAVFEERSLQDMLLCRVQAPSCSVKEQDSTTLWEHRLTELLDKRQRYLQKMASILEKLWASVRILPGELADDIREWENLKEQLMYSSESVADAFLSSVLDRWTAVAPSRNSILQGINTDQRAVLEELKLLAAQADCELREERSKRSSLLQGLEGAALQTELSLLNHNQLLLRQLQHTQEKVKALCGEVERLEQAQVKASHRVSNHKQATQLLQTELQDSRAHLEERERTIQTLKSKLREPEKNESANAAELEQLRNKLFTAEVELNSVSDKHQQKILMMTTLLNEKEESVRKLKENLRKSQQQEDESFFQGKALHARLTQPRGVLIQSSALLEKAKLEEEIKRLQLKISELESLVSNQHDEINKWKSRAIKLKGKSKPEVDRPSSPCTPTKRGFAVAANCSDFIGSPKKYLITPKKVLDSARNPLDSPNAFRLDSPKRSLFDLGASSDLLSRARPRQFFDNSSLGTLPDVSNVPDTSDGDNDADRREELWPLTPTQEKMCSTQ